MLWCNRTVTADCVGSRRGPVRSRGVPSGGAPPPRRKVAKTLVSILLGNALISSKNVRPLSIPDALSSR